MSERVASAVSGHTEVPSAGCPSRRAMLAAIPGVAVLPGVLSACGMQAPEAPTSEQQTTEVPETVVRASDIPVGTARQVEVGSEHAIVAQPTEGEFVAYSARCTHQGGIVQVVDDTRLRCPLHGAEYDPATGDVLAPPAPRPLDQLTVTSDGDELTIT